jgi:hypothetical protein
VLLISACALLSGCATSPFETFYMAGYTPPVQQNIPLYTGPPLSPGKVDPPVSFLQPTSIAQARGFAAGLASQGYRRIGVSMFESDWSSPHRKEAASWGKKVGADLVVYVLTPARVITKNQAMGVIDSSPRVETSTAYGTAYNPYLGTTTGSATSTTFIPGQYHTEIVSRQVTRYMHIVGYMTRR